MFISIPLIKTLKETYNTEMTELNHIEADKNGYSMDPKSIYNVDNLSRMSYNIDNLNNTRRNDSCFVSQSKDHSNPFQNNKKHCAGLNSSKIIGKKGHG